MSETVKAVALEYWGLGLAIVQVTQKKPLVEWQTPFALADAGRQGAAGKPKAKFK
jgi:hypothetical protein